MLVSKDINPERQVYYLGAMVIEIMKKSQSKRVNFLEVFYKLNEKENISIGLYTLVLDWLFIIGLITKNKKGVIEKCF